MRALKTFLMGILRVPCSCHIVVNSILFAITIAGPFWNALFVELRASVNHAVRTAALQEAVIQHGDNTHHRKIHTLYLKRFTGYVIIAA